MDIHIGKNIKHLRKAKDISQEELAEFLNISFQSVSKWERGESFPDITMLPSLANFFDVSLDELLGMDEIRNENKLNDIFRIAHEYENDNKYGEATEILRKAIKTFPNNYGLLSELALALSLTDETSGSNANAQEAIALCERVLANCINEKVRSTTRATLCFSYEISGEHQKALDLVRTLPHIWESREMILPELFKGQEQIDSLKKSIHVILSVLYEKVDAIEHSERFEKEMVRTLALGSKEKPESFESKAKMFKKIMSFVE